MLHTPPDGAVRGTTAGGNGTSRSIGAVLRELRREFPEVTLSKIRFLESEGLVQPERSPSGYRKFRDEDVERLGYVLRMQRDHYLPLRVIREHLETAGPRGRPPGCSPEPPGEGPATPGPPGPYGAAEPASRAPQLRVGRAELLAAAGAGEEELAEWEAYGLVGPDAEGRYGTDEVAVARLVAELRRFGLEPRHLRTVKAAADREAGLIEQIVAPQRRHRDPRIRARAEATARELGVLVARLHAALVRSALGLRAP